MQSRWSVPQKASQWVVTFAPKGDNFHLVDALDIKCPNCGAAPGEACRLGLGVPCGRRIESSADPLEVECPDCRSLVGKACMGVRRGKRRELPDPHAYRIRTAQDEKGRNHGVTFAKLVAQAPMKGTRRR